MLEAKAKTELHLAALAPRSKESVDHLKIFTVKFEAACAAVEGLEADAKEDKINEAKDQLESNSLEAKVHSEGMQLAIRSYKKWVS